MQYVKDLMSVLTSNGIFNSNWEWKCLHHSDSWTEYEILHYWTNGTYTVDTEMTAVFDEVWPESEIQVY